MGLDSGKLSPLELLAAESAVLVMRGLMQAVQAAPHRQGILLTGHGHSPRCRLYQGTAVHRLTNNARAVQMGEMPKYPKRGLASMTPERRKQIASMGGKAAHAAGTAHQYTTEEAVKYAAMGGTATAKRGRAYMAKLGHRGGTMAQKRAASRRPQPTLHEAMRLMLLEKPEQTARYHDLAEENRRRGLYRTEGGGYPIAARLQVRARAHPHWFDHLGGGKVRLKVPTGSINTHHLSR